VDGKPSWAGYTGQPGHSAVPQPVFPVLPSLLLQHLPEDAPVLILLPGLTGGSEDSYVQHAVVRRVGQAEGGALHRQPPAQPRPVALVEHASVCGPSSGHVSPCVAARP
jgi:hypothetical protein